MAIHDICSANEVLPHTGEGVLIGGKQFAIFRTGDNKLYATDNYDPFSKVNVLSRGIVGDLQEQRVVASPIYKQHFNLETGVCLEDENVSIGTYAVEEKDGRIFLSLT